MAEEKEGTEEKASKPKKDWKKILSLVFVVINLVGVSFFTFVIYKSTLGFVKDPISEEKLRVMHLEKLSYFEDNPILYSMDPFVVNLAGDPARTIQLELSLEMISEKGYEEVITKTVEARDRIVKILNAKTFDELESLQGKLRLKDEILVSLNSQLNEGVVKGIYFTNLVVQ